MNDSDLSRQAVEALAKVDGILGDYADGRISAVRALSRISKATIRGVA